jgi:hypothetical protein
MDITNNNSSLIVINRFFAYWDEVPNSQKIERLFLNGTVIWNTSDPDAPSDIPTEGNWVSGADTIIPGTNTPGANARTFLIQFANDLQSPVEVHLVFDIGCQVIGTK